MTEDSLQECNHTDRHMFVKNRYYPGKLLHAADFTQEQEYGSSKLHFLNRKLYGGGIVEGLHISRADEDSLYISAGSALDDRGRILAVMEDRKVPLSKIRGLDRIEGGTCILGLHYHEKTIDTEFYPLEEEGKRYKSSRIAESSRLHAYSPEQWQVKRSSRRQEIGRFFDSCILFEDAQVKITAVVPLTVPQGSRFHLRILTEAVGQEPVRVSYSCHMEAQGGRFEGGRHHHMLLQGEEQTVTSNSTKTVHMVTERRMDTVGEVFFPVLLELKNVEVHINGLHFESSGQHHFSIRTVGGYQEYHNEIREALGKEAPGEEENEEDQWVPLARLHLKNSDEDRTERILSSVETAGVRLYAASPRLEGIFQAVENASGILPFVQDQEWPLPPLPPAPKPPAPGPPPAPPYPWTDPPITEAQVKELLEEKWEERIHRGVVVLKIPKHYKKGQVLYSETVSHGFPGEEVILWQGRVREETNYAYWERDKKRHYVIQGREGLFQKREDRQRPIEEQALQINIEEGTFRIALTMQKKAFRRYEESEVAVSWVALRMT